MSPLLPVLLASLTFSMAVGSALPSPIRIGFLTPYPDTDSAVPLRLADEWISALRVAVELLGADYESSFRVQLFVQNSDCSSRSAQEGAMRLVRSGVVGVVGPACSEAAIGAASVLGQHGIPLISFAATAPELSDRTSYPTFFRLVYPDTYQAKALVDSAVLFNFTKIYVLYSDEAYGRGLLNSLFEEVIVANEKRSRPMDVVALPVPVHAPQGGYEYLFSSIEAEPRVPVLMATTPKVAEGLWEAAMASGKLDYPWWYFGTDGATAFDLIGEGETYRNLAYNMQGEIGLYPHEGNTSQTSPYRRYLDTWASLTYSSYPGLLTFPRFPRYTKPRAFVPYLIDAVWAFYVAISTAIQKGEDVTSQSILTVLSDPSFGFEGCTGTVGFSAFSGDRDTSRAPPEYTLVSLGGTTWNLVGTWKIGQSPAIAVADTSVRRPGNGSDTTTAEVTLPAGENSTATVTETAGPAEVSAPALAPDLAVQPPAAPLPADFNGTATDSPAPAGNLDVLGDDDANTKDKRSISIAAVALIAVPIALGLVLAGFGVCLYVQKKRQEATSFVRIL